MLVPTVRTECTEKELCKALIQSWIELFSNRPSKETICIIMAQHQLETGGKNTWNWNLANIKYVDSNGDVDYCILKGVWEIVNGKKVILKETDPGSRFRSFPTLKDGAKFYLNFINGKRYKNAWDALVAGDPKLFVSKLKSAGYFTADENLYYQAVSRFYNQFMKKNNFEEAMKELQQEQEQKANEAEPTISFNTINFEPRVYDLKDEPINLTFWQKIASFFMKKPF